MPTLLGEAHQQHGPGKMQPHPAAIGQVQERLEESRKVVVQLAHAVQRLALDVLKVARMPPELPGRIDAVESLIILIPIDPALAPNRVQVPVFQSQLLKERRNLTEWMATVDRKAQKHSPGNQNLLEAIQKLRRVGNMLQYKGRIRDMHAAGGNGACSRTV